MLLKHQQEGLEIAKKHNRWLFAHDTGTGKTLLGLSIIKQKQAMTLIVAPKILLRDAWLSDAYKFYPEIANVMVDWHTIKNKKDRDTLIKKAPILLINYESLLEHPEVFEYFDMLILDESQKIKNAKAKITKMILKHCMDYNYIYLLSGTPAPNSELEYYAQLRLVMPAQVDNSWYRFRQTYFVSTDRNGWKWKLDPYKTNEFKQLVAQGSTAVKKEDVLDLKGQFYRVVDFGLDSNEKNAYKGMKKDLLLEIEDDKITASAAVVKLMKLRQILSGFVISDSKQVKHIGNSKFNALNYFLELNPTESFIIWTQYTYEAQYLHSKLENSALMIGETSDQDRNLYLDMFRRGEIKYLIAHPKVIGHGVTLTNINKAIYYSLSYSYEEFKQSQDRIYRITQDRAVIYYLLLSEDKLIDWAIWRILERKRTNADEILDFIKGGL